MRSMAAARSEYTWRRAAAEVERILAHVHRRNTQTLQNTMRPSHTEFK